MSKKLMKNLGQKKDDEIKSGKYQHHSGKLYQVIGIAHHSETLEEMVVYQACYDDKKFGKRALWVRPKRLFLEEVEREGKKMLRFKLIRK